MTPQGGFPGSSLSLEVQLNKRVPTAEWSGLGTRPLSYTGETKGIIIINYYAVNETVRVLIRVLIRVRVRVRVRVRALYFDLSAIRIFRMSHSTIAQHNIAQHSVVVVFL